MKELLNKPLKTIGVLINEVCGWYGSAIIKGIKKVALERNINLLIFPGGSINGTWRDEVQNNIIYKIVNKEKLDGLIITSGSLFNYLDLKESNKFLDDFNGIPIVSIATEIPNGHSILFDNKSSMYSVVSHLIEHHNYTRIAFISGLFSNPEGQERYAGYLAALQDHNIPFDKTYIVEGNFTEASGTKATEVLFDQIQVNPQAIVASNDQMAIGAYHKLTEMGFEIGKDMALTGFDNSDEVKFFITPLTTISQPTFMMGALAAECICDLLDGKEVIKCSYVKGELIVRDSCGCLNISSKETIINNLCFLNDTAIDFHTAVENFSNNLKLNKEVIITSTLKQLIVPSSRNIEIRKTLANLLDNINEDIKAKNIKGLFFKNLNSLLKENVVIKNQIFNWNNFILYMRSSILKNVTSYEILSLIEDIFYSACILTNTVLTRFEAYDSYNFRMLSIDNKYVSKDFNNVLSLEDLINILLAYMLKVDITACYLCLYDTPTIYIPNNVFPLPDKIKLFLCSNDEYEYSIEYFNTLDMLPNKYLSLKERHDLIFFPIFTGNLHFGFIAFPVNNINENIFENIRELISNSLNSLLILNERKNAEEQLQIAVKKLEKYNHELHNLSIIDELTGLYNRRGFYIQGENHYKWACSNNESFILFYGDLDGLKKINDNFGHKYGDEALKTTAMLLKSVFRNSDILCRLGGDEYTALATTVSSSDSLQLILERIDYSFNNFNTTDTLPFKLSISIGYSIYEPNSHFSFDELMQEADSKLYEEKKRKKASINKS